MTTTTQTKQASKKTAKKQAPRSKRPVKESASVQKARAKMAAQKKQAAKPAKATAAQKKRLAKTMTEAIVGKTDEEARKRKTDGSGATAVRARIEAGLRGGGSVQRKDLVEAAAQAIGSESASNVVAGTVHRLSLKGIIKKKGRGTYERGANYDAIKEQ